MDETASLASDAQHSAVQWRFFLRALAEEVDSLAGAGDRDDMLRGVGRRMARLMPLPPVQSLQALEIEINEVLHGVNWGEVELRLNDTDRVLYITHTGFPRVGSLGTPSGQWLSALLEGLYDSWFAHQPGSKPSLSTRRLDTGSGATVMMSYARR